MQIGSKKVVTDLFGNSWLMPAMEEGVADLTRETNGMMKKSVAAAGQAAAGGAVDFDDGSTEPDVTSDETHAANGDDLSGPDDFSEDPNSVPGMGGDDMGMGDDGMGGMGMDDGMGGGGFGDDGMGMDGEQTLTPINARRFRGLQENMAVLGNSIANNLKTLSNYTPSSTTPEIRKGYNGALDHLTEMKKLLTDLMCTEFTEKNYPEKLRRYVALRHVYSLTVDQLINLFHAIDIENGRDPDNDAEKPTINT